MSKCNVSPPHTHFAGGEGWRCWAVFLGIGAKNSLLRSWNRWFAQPRCLNMHCNFHVYVLLVRLHVCILTRTPVHAGTRTTVHVQRDILIHPYKDIALEYSLGYCPRVLIRILPSSTHKDIALEYSALSMYMYLYTCTCIYVYAYVYTHSHTHTKSQRKVGTPSADRTKAKLGCRVSSTHWNTVLPTAVFPRQRTNKRNPYVCLASLIFFSYCEGFVFVSSSMLQI